MEIMTCTPAIRNLIREAKAHQITSSIQTSSNVGMQTMDQCLRDLYHKGQISLEEAQQLRRTDKSVETLLQAGLRGAEVRAQRAKPRAGAIEDFPRRSDRVLDRGGHVGRWAGEAGPRGKRRIRADVGEEPLCGAHRVRHRDQLVRIERAPKPRPPQRVTDVACAAEAGRRVRADELARGGGLILKPLPFAQIGRRKKRFRELSPGRERSAIGKKAPDRGKLETAERALVQKRETPLDPRT